MWQAFSCPVCMSIVKCISSGRSINAAFSVRQYLASQLLVVGVAYKLVSGHTHHTPPRRSYRSIVCDIESTCAIFQGPARHEISRWPENDQNTSRTQRADPRVDYIRTRLRKVMIPDWMSIHTAPPERRGMDR
jgi:hypothetical protein